ncbi:hypothetical protein Ancab_023380 [Ancistrocladus abbreviatus]
MGVQGLWDLLAPVGRRVSVETLAMKCLAIDASIWLIQFMKAMRDEKGEMVRNAHLIGFFRRICKLLFLRTKPVFVFDGGTPVLKRRTVIARRRQRENAQAKIRKTAEKLLLNQLKTMRLKELAESFEKQKLQNNVKGKKVLLDQVDPSGANYVIPEQCNNDKIDEMLAASLAAEQRYRFNGGASASSCTTGDFFDGRACSSDAAVSLDDENDEDEEEMILPMTNESVDPAILAALPPSMQLDLLVQMRERLMAENRQKYQKVNKAPKKFSELQIEAYLKTVAFRREINEVQKAAAGKGVGGVQTSRIASEANREFIFSSSFTGDKQVLASAGVSKADENQEKIGKGDSSLVLLHGMASTVKSSTGAASAADEPLGGFSNEVQTYIDERGHTRVSRVRAMGIRMTRDLQRNLDLMRECEQDRLLENPAANVQVILNEKEFNLPGNQYSGNQLLEIADEFNHETGQGNCANSMSTYERCKHRTLEKKETSMEISFDDVGDHKSLDGDDELFVHLVAGDPVAISPAVNPPSIMHTSDSASDCEWEEGIVGEEDSSLGIDINSEMKLFQVEESDNNEIELKLDGEMCDFHKDASSCPSAYQNPLSKGSLEEEATLQEAIRRSLEDLNGRFMFDVSSEMDKTAEKVDPTSVMLIQQESDAAGPSSQLGNSLQDSGCSGSVFVRGRSDDMGGNNNSDNVGSHGMQVASVAGITGHGLRVLNDRPSESFQTLDHKYRTETADRDRNFPGENLKIALLDSDVGQNTYDAIPRCDSIEAPDNTIHQEESITNEPASHNGIKGQLAEEGCYDGTQKIEHDVEISARKSDGEGNIEVSRTSLEDELRGLSQEYLNLGEEQRKLERNADSVSSEMFVECQELLQMFGLPYIVAPMEAEAQCAYLELANLVDGVVTDDSDVFLFGARNVYKNIFDDRKYVETYIMQDVENELGLNREKLIRMALLLGSDYTEGISGIGIVNAVEVINAFPEEDGLYKFREWIESPDPSILGRLGMQSGSVSKKRGSKPSDSSGSGSKSDIEGTSAPDFSASQENEDEQAASEIQKTRQIFMDKHRNVSKNWHVPSSFPSEVVISAYTSPQVDKSTEAFSWGKPDLFALRRLCWDKFGWGSQKADEVLLPVLKEYNKHETQLRLEAFYTFNERFAKIRSKRIKKAVKGITGKQSFESITDVDAVQEVPENMKTRKMNTTYHQNKRKASPSRMTDSFARDLNKSTEMLKLPRKKRPRKEELLSEGGDVQLSNQSPEKWSHGYRRGRVRGREGAEATGKGRSKQGPGSEFAETSSGYSDCDIDEQEVKAGKSEAPHDLRKSLRPRKAANYVESDVEVDDPTDFLEQSEPNDSTKQAIEQEWSHSQSSGRDDVADFSVMRCHTGDDSMHDDDMQRDYLVTGGGFCADEDDPGTNIAQQDPIHNDGAPSVCDTDYLQMDGGFCVSDGDLRQELHECVPNQTREAASEIPGPSISSGGANETEHNTGDIRLILSAVGPSERLRHEQMTDENLEDEQERNDSISRGEKSIQEMKDNSPIKALSAMPYLRKNRRRRSSN